MEIHLSNLLLDSISDPTLNLEKSAGLQVMGLEWLNNDNEKRINPVKAMFIVITPERKGGGVCCISPTVKQFPTVNWILAMVSLVADALRESGRRLNRENFINRIENYYDHLSLSGPDLTFSANRKIGAIGGVVMRVDHSTKKDLRMVGCIWIKINY